MKLSVNLNKIALIRNSRGSNNPSLIDYASQCIELGVDGLTLHPRPDHRHATSEDAINLSKLCKDHNIEFNLEGNPFSIPDGAFIGFQELCAQANPHQVTLVPDNLQQITSDHGWQPGFLDNELKGFIGSLKDSNARTSLFIDANASFQFDGRRKWCHQRIIRRRGWDNHRAGFDLFLEPSNQDSHWFIVGHHHTNRTDGREQAFPSGQY